MRSYFFVVSLVLMLGGFFSFNTTVSATNMMGGSQMMNKMRNLSTISINELKSFYKIPVAGVRINKKTNTVKFLDSKITIPIIAYPDEDNMYAFGVYGLVNPTIVVKKGSVITIKLVNKDDDMPHAIMITKTQPPYNNMPMMMNSVAFGGAVIMPIPKKSNSGYYVDSTIFTATTPGVYYYICQIPGHAAKGMYGKFVVLK